ncbi:hypothetical protein HPB48_008706 [Haemaphysalis longicornis]|uniref:Uncharacterized protein n=1 Tax=Haemaphysalis longicornis TaxID=44386 RepID=A0A9J6H1E1_HAELO|nr:hypothetical protein HPB48_008706 [Haemaphysalis longicornis]
MEDSHSILIAVEGPRLPRQAIFCSAMTRLYPPHIHCLVIAQTLVQLEKNCYVAGTAKLNFPHNGTPCTPTTTANGGASVVPEILPYPTSHARLGRLPIKPSAIELEASEIVIAMVYPEHQFTKTPGLGL